MQASPQTNPKLDLVFERLTSLSAEQIWQGWTDPHTLMKWFCPKPWRVTDCRIDLTPGGEFYSVMEGPDGGKSVNQGCYLEVVEYKKLVWTGMMSKGFRPNPVPPNGFHFVATIHLTSGANGTLYKAVVAHPDEASRVQHEQMGFQEGWSKAFEQLIEHWSR